MSVVHDGFELIELLHRHVPSDFNPDDFVIAGSARLIAHGIAQPFTDLDLLVRPGSKTWQRALELAFEHASEYEHVPLKTSSYTGAKIALLYGGAIEVCETWVLPGSTEELLAEAEEIDGLKYLPMREVIAYKLTMNRKKDVADLAAICGRPLASHGRFPILSEL
ncbi:hypothetical protein [Glycomyces tritici]|uniref:Uncharacterized protein n=1 Tax=Glycomyces tritici TaxID=2665176 RepID=A0ABT7YLB3_9ACTN|nr:hypothetical protein [Glycomyces tritici]MDN3239421.1 hypothetical protein [Glycomyces tritici]